MMKKHFTQFCLGVSALLWVSCAAALNDPAKGAELSAACVACHNADGNSVVDLWPKLAGQNPKYLYKQLQAFKQGQDGPRWNATMDPIIADLNDEDFSDLAAYFATQKMTPGGTVKSLYEQGRTIYRAGIPSKGVPACMACHGPAGQGNAPGAFPRLGGQQPGYLTKQLKDFASGARKNSPSEIMEDLAKRMSEAEMQAVASYASGLHN